MKNLPGQLVVSFLILFQSFSNAQSSALAIGSWREHIPFNKAIDVTEDNSGLLYCATRFGLFSYSKNTGELYTFSRLKELSDLEISHIRFDKQTNALIIAYSNSNIDIIYPDKSVVNLPDIKQKNIVGGKHINSIIFINGFAYLACDFGIVVLDLARREIKDTYYIVPDGTQLIVNGIAYDGMYLMAVTDNGIYKAVFTDPNIFNYTGWVKEISMSEPSANYTSTTFFSGRFYATKTNAARTSDSLMVNDNNQWIPFISDGTPESNIDSYNNFLFYKQKNEIGVFDANGNKVRYIDNGMYPFAKVQRGFIDDQGYFWVADLNNGLVWQRNDGYIQMAHPNGPNSEAAWSMKCRGGVLWVSTGVIVGDSPNTDAKFGVYRFSDNAWNSYDLTNDTVYQNMCLNSSPATNCVAIDPSDANHSFVGSWGSGILEYRKEGGVKRYKTYNSALHPLSVDSGRLNVGGVTFDDDGNLWAVACGSPKAISTMKADGSWQDFILSETALTGFSLYDLVVDDYGQKWFCARNSSVGEGICVFKEENLNSPYNGKFKRLSDDVGNGALPDMFVRSLAKDKDGAIWIGCNKGVGVIYNPGNVFSGGKFDAEKIIIEQDGYNQYLLETEFVNTIAIDGANRKWFGTYSGGAFLMSADGRTQILNFNKDNSPLPTNYVASIAVDDVSGEVFFATDKGIFSYRGDATEGGEVCNNYFVFPNPVRHEYHGPIAIKGLVENADVKIADVAGNVVYHTKANGGEAIWNGNNFEGVRARTGVYIVYVSNEDGSQTCATKMLFAN